MGHAPGEQVPLKKSAAFFLFLREAPSHVWETHAGGIPRLGTSVVK